MANCVYCRQELQHCECETEYGYDEELQQIIEQLKQ